MKINKLTVDNFQGHAHSELEFDPHVNIITGDTDSGKTSLFRALMKVVRDTPHGAEFISTWADDCTITVDLEDGIQVKRLVAGKKDKDGKAQLDSHSYTVEQNGNVESYTGFGMVVPQDVEDAFKMPLITAGKEQIDLNFSDQHNPYFLVKKADGLTRVKLFSKLSHADVLEDTRGEIKTLERSLKGTIKAQLDLLTRTNDEIAEFAKFKEAKPYLVDAKSLIVDIEKKKKVIELINTIVNITTQINAMQIKMGELSCLLIQQEMCITRLSTIMEQRMNITNVYSSVLTTEQQIKQLPSMVDLKELIPQGLSVLSKLSDKVKDVQTLKTLYSGYTLTLNSITDSEKELYTFYLKGKTIQKEFEDALQKDNLCPTCHSTIDSQAVSYLTGGFFK